MLVEEFELGILWDEYGLVGDVIVCIHVFFFVLLYLLTYAPQPFTNHFPRADIHELLSPDILHQLIKGAFKDHVVTWVNEYIKARHREKKANKILDDIDQRYIFIPRSIIVTNCSNDL
jgi:Plavaka transposase